jgi:hypothetical protein
LERGTIVFLRVRIITLGGSATSGDMIPSSVGWPDMAMIASTIPASMSWPSSSRL